MSSIEPKNTVRHDSGALDHEGLSKEWRDVSHCDLTPIMYSDFVQFEKVLGFRPMAELAGKQPAELRQSAKDVNAGRNRGYIQRNPLLESAVDVQNSDFVTDGVTIPIRIYHPKNSAGPAPAAVYYHGGGWIIGSIEEDDIFCRMIVRDLGHVVVSVEYRMAPECVYPIAVDDSYGALLWVGQYPFLDKRTSAFLTSRRPSRTRIGSALTRARSTLLETQLEVLEDRPRRWTRCTDRSRTFGGSCRIASGIIGNSVLTRRASSSSASRMPYRCVSRHSTEQTRGSNLQ
jgi:hypothetical protein